MRQCVSIMAEQKLIDYVRYFPCLWQVSSCSYSDARARENAWKQNSSQVCQYNLNGRNTELSWMKECLNALKNGKCYVRD